MFKRLRKAMFNVIVFLLVTAVVSLGLPRIVTGFYALPRSYDVSGVPARQAAVVFGAGLLRDGSPTAVLRDRVRQAANLYFAKKVEKLLMSGDNRYVDYNEPESMRQYALSLGVPDEAIVRDYAGRSTYDTCYRAKAIFGLSRAILVTQQFHLPRALFLCNLLGLDAVGVDADLQPYSRSSQLWWNLRELPATFNACIDLVVRPLPVLGNPEPIFPGSAQ
jgi:SanA protein